MEDAILSVLTVGEIAKRCRCPVHQVEYIIRSRHLQPVARAGRARIFAAEDLDFINRTLTEIAGRSVGVHRAPSGKERPMI